jgi:CO/xanthine dehydrogenase Mo-binding subunit
LWDVPVEEVTFANGTFTQNGHSLSFKQAAEELSKVDVPIVASAAVQPKGVGNAFGTHIVDVEVDPETGKVTILRYTAVQDVGTAIHPSYVEGQIQGGVVQGIGWALNEEYFYNDKGQLLNASLLDYRMPTALDLPMIDTVMVEVKNPGHRAAGGSVGGRHLPCGGCAYGRVADVPAEGYGGHSGQW